MKTITLTSRIKTYLASVTLTQTICLLASLPFLIVWGLPISHASFVGNLIFLPFLIVFLIVSSLLFFITLVGLTCPPLEWLLELIVFWWRYTLSWGSKSWLVSFPTPPLWTVALCTVVIMIIMYRFRSYGLKTPIIASALTLVVCISYSLLTTPGHQRVHTFVAPKGNLNIIANPSRTLTIIDYGYFNGRKDAEKTVLYTLKPWCLQQYGMMVIDRLIMTAVTPKSLQAARAFATLFTVKKIVMPWFEPFAEKKDWVEYYRLKNIAQDQKIIIERQSLTEEPYAQKHRRKVGRQQGRTPQHRTVSSHQSASRENHVPLHGA